MPPRLHPHAPAEETEDLELLRLSPLAALAMNYAGCREIEVVANGTTREGLGLGDGDEVR